MEIRIIDIIGRSVVSRVSGEKLRVEIEKQIDSSKIIMNFEDVEFYASPFFNTSIAPFFEHYDLDILQSKFEFINMTPVGRNLLNQVIHNAIDFYSKSAEEQDSLTNKVETGLNDFKEE